MTVKAVKGGYQLHSLKNPKKALGPVRSSPDEVKQKDEKRVQFFQNLKNSSGGPGSLAAKVKKTKPALVEQVKGPPEKPADLPSAKETKARKAKVRK